MDKVIDLNVVSLGQEVPDFKMESFNPELGGFSEVSLADIKGQGKWTILMFYPADYTFVCPTELADLSKKHVELKEMGAEVVAVSTDTKFVHLAWHRDEKLLNTVKYQMGSDPTGNVSRLFGVYDENTGLALRGSFVINPQGVLVGSEINYYNVGRNADELLRKFKAFTHVAKHPEEVCPANWDTGSNTLKPSEKIVGRVYEQL